MEVNNTVLWLWIKESTQYNNKKTLKLVDYFGSAEEVFDAESFNQCSFLTDSEIKTLNRKNLRSAWEIYGECTENGIEILTLDDEDYPPLLREIENPPSPLFVKGNLSECLNKPLLTVVGTRKATGYGESMTKKIVTGVCQCGLSIVCGIAGGIDTFAIESAIYANSNVIAVLPYGHLANNGYSTKLFADILVHGAVISEYFPHKGSHKYAYHERNRILSGLSYGTFIVQAPLKSGALITANYALEQGRELFALMANACPEFEGSNNLIKDGCYPVTDYTDIIQVYLPQFHDEINETGTDQEKVFSLQQELTEDQLTAYKKKHGKKLTDDENTVFQLITTEECITDYIIENAKLPPEQVLQCLTTLEFRGLIISCPGSKFKIIL